MSKVGRADKYILRCIKEGKIKVDTENGEVNRKKAKYSDMKYSRKFRQVKSRDPFGGSAQAKGIVIQRKEVEPRQPNSGKRKCVVVQLLKNSRTVTAFCPGVGAIYFIDEHDEVLLEGIGGRSGRSFGDDALVKGKKEKPIR